MTVRDHRRLVLLCHGESEWNRLGSSPARPTWSSPSSALRQDAIVPDLRARRTLIVAAHGNSLRALAKPIDAIGDSDIAALNIPTGIPLLYELDADLPDFGPIDGAFGVSGRYLDETVTRSSIEAVRTQGATLVAT
jgi:broad specificity phosphatase PhoE